MMSLPDGEKNFEDIFIRFDVIHERVRQTDRWIPSDSEDRALMHMHRAVKMHTV